MKRTVIGFVLGLVVGCAVEILAAPEIKHDPDGATKAAILTAAQVADLKVFLSDAKVDQVTTLSEWRTYQKTMLRIYRKHLKLTFSQLDTE